MKSLILFFENQKKLTTGLAIAWTIVIFIGCSLPGKELPKMGLFDHFDKIIHFTFFGLFFMLWYLTTSKSNIYALIIIIISLIYGFGIEFYQLHYVAGRSFDVWDGVADGLGALSGWGVIWFIKK